MAAGATWGGGGWRCRAGDDVWGGFVGVGAIALGAETAGGGHGSGVVVGAGFPVGGGWVGRAGHAGGLWGSDRDGADGLAHGAEQGVANDLGKGIDANLWAAGVGSGAVDFSVSVADCVEYVSGGEVVFNSSAGTGFSGECDGGGAGVLWA